MIWKKTNEIEEFGTWLVVKQVYHGGQGRDPLKPGLSPLLLMWSWGLCNWSWNVRRSWCHALSPGHSVMVRAGDWRFAFISLPPHLGNGWCQREGVFIRMNCFQIFPAHLLPIVVQQEMQEPAPLWICLLQEIADLKPAGRDSPAAHSRQG